jgi:demethylmenaquinone methyltransferase/2-methoxy-6-polyprenyl-1,4-benzoquinol methylase
MAFPNRAGNPLMKQSLSNTFGESKVSIEEREKLIRSVFNRVASRYDLMNDLMSMGIHRFWKWIFCREVNKAQGHTFVDLAGGTGDIAGALIDNRREILLVDPSKAMMKVAEKRFGNACRYITATAESLPFEDNSVDVLTISFGIRNATDIEQSLREITRVLKPGGLFYCLEFSTPHAWLRPLYNAWSRIVIPRLGAAVAGHSDAYSYLIESIRAFPAQEEMAEIIRATGLKHVSYRNLTFGIACIHRAVKMQQIKY